jgi:hypothetical protein
MPGSPTAPGRPGACNGAPVRIAFHQQNDVGTQIDVAFAAQWLAYAIPYRRFAATLTGDAARLGADVVCYSFIVVDLHVIGAEPRALSHFSLAPIRRCGLSASCATANRPFRAKPPRA